MEEISVFDDVLLSPLKLEDAIDIYNTINSQRDYLGKWLPFVANTTSVEFTRIFVESIVNAPQEQHEPTFTIQQSGKFVGLIGFKLSDKNNHKTEIGYWLSNESQGQGIVTRSVEKLCQYAFSKMKMNRVQIKCAIGNTSSQAIPQRLNFTFEGIERAGELSSDGHFFDLSVYSLLSTD